MSNIPDPMNEYLGYFLAERQDLKVSSSFGWTDSEMVVSCGGQIIRLPSFTEPFHGLNYQPCFKKALSSDEQQQIRRYIEPLFAQAGLVVVNRADIPKRHSHHPVLRAVQKALEKTDHFSTCHTPLDKGDPKAPLFIIIPADTAKVCDVASHIHRLHRNGAIDTTRIVAHDHIREAYRFG